MAEVSDFLSDDDEDLDSDESEKDDGAAEADAETGAKPPESSGDKRLRDLQSRADKAEAKANKLQKQLEQVQSGASAQSESDPSVPPEVRMWLDAAQDRLRDQLYAGDARFAEFGFPASLIQGKTPVAMRESAKELSGLMDTLETKVRDKVLREHGIQPVPMAGERTRGKSVEKMSTEEFKQYVDTLMRSY